MPKSEGFDQKSPCCVFAISESASDRFYLRDSVGRVGVEVDEILEYFA